MKKRDVGLLFKVLLKDFQARAEKEGLTDESSSIILLKEAKDAGLQ